MSMPSVSVVICTKDRPEMLRRCLSSIMRGKALPVEVVVVDQSTDDQTAMVVREFYGIVACPVRRIAADSKGLAIARNIGLKAAFGSVIAFTDDDCTADSGWLSAIAREFVDNTVTCVCGHVYPADHTDRPMAARVSTLNHQRRRVVAGRCNPFLLGRGNNMAFRKSDLLKLGGFNEYIGVGSSVYAGEDLDILYRLMEVGGPIVHCPYAIVYHSQPDDWRNVLKKKRGYSLAAAATLVSRARNGDLCAAALMIGKVLYEFGYLLCGGLVRLNPFVAKVGWHSVIGSLSGLKYAFDSPFCDRINGLSRFARESYSRHVVGRQIR